MNAQVRKNSKRQLSANQKQRIKTLGSLARELVREAKTAVSRARKEAIEQSARQHLDAFLEKINGSEFRNLETLRTAIIKAAKAEKRKIKFSADSIWINGAVSDKKKVPIVVKKINALFNDCEYGKTLMDFCRREKLTLSVVIKSVNGQQKSKIMRCEISISWLSEPKPRRYWI